MTAVYYSLQWNTEQYFDTSLIRYTFSLPRSTAAEKESLDSWPPSSALALFVPDVLKLLLLCLKARGQGLQSGCLLHLEGSQPLVLLDSPFQCFQLLRFFFNGVRCLASKLLLRVEAVQVG